MKEFDVICNAGEGREMFLVGRHVGRNTLSIRGISVRWYDEKANYFKVAVSGGRVCIFQQNIEDNRWHLLSTWALDT